MYLFHGHRLPVCTFRSSPRALEFPQHLHGLQPRQSTGAQQCTRNHPEHNERSQPGQLQARNDQPVGGDGKDHTQENDEQAGEQKTDRRDDDQAQPADRDGFGEQESAKMG